MDRSTATAGLFLVLLFSCASCVSGEDQPKNNTATSCAALTNCGDCTDDRDCVWCETDGNCQDGGFYGVSGELFGGCRDWRWGQCKGA